jgi:hypothetical protein
MKENDKISNSKGNWFIVEILEKCEPVLRNEDQELRRVLTYGNHHLIKANTPKEAYEKAVKIGKENEYQFVNTRKEKMEWIFVGIGDLLPIYEENIEDGCELMWRDYGSISNKRATRLALTEFELLNNIQLKR